MQNRRNFGKPEYWCRKSDANVLDRQTPEEDFRGRTNRSGLMKRTRALPRHEMMDRKMFSEAENNSSLASDALHAWLSLLVKFPSPVLLAIVDG